MRTKISNGLVVFPDGPGEADLVLENGVISAVCGPGTGGAADHTIDAKGKIVFPGVIDPHVHLGYGVKPDDYRDETASAACGGVSTVISYNWTTGSYAEWFAKEKALGESLSHIDFAYHFGLVDTKQFPLMPQLQEEFGVSSFKFLMQYMYGPGLKKDLHLVSSDMFDLLRQRAAQGKGLICVHCEDPELIELLAAPQKEKQGPEAWLNSREGITEAKGLQTLLDFMRYTNSPALAVHLSGKEAAALVRKAAQEKGRPRLYVETCPHYLMLTHENSQDTFGKVNPPLRRQEDCDALWDLISDGYVDVIGSDHIARPQDKKEGGTWKALAGFPGSYAILPVLFAEGHLKRRYPLEKVAALTSGNAAKLFGLYPRKGRIAPGADADLAILDPDQEMDFSSAAVASKPGYSLYEHLRLRGRPVMTLVRGMVVMENGAITGPVGHGRYVRRNDAPGLP